MSHVLESEAPSRLNAKAFGAYYTGARVAEFLSHWAIRNPEEPVFDPSFGGGIFLRSACERIRRLGGDPSRTVWGVELDATVHAQISTELCEEFALPKGRLFCANFFDLSATSLLPASAAIGNPPFIRYQRFSGANRESALKRAAEAGVSLNNLSSSWAPFVIHSVSALVPGGRLAMVVPMEISYTGYARKVLEFLQENFRQVILLTFRKRLFQELNEDVGLLLADDKRQGCAEFFVCDIEDDLTLRYLDFNRNYIIRNARRLDTYAMLQGEQRLTEHLIPASGRLLYRTLSKNSRVSSLGKCADIGIGYVTGANEFFHLDKGSVKKWDIPKRYLKPAVRRGASLRGVRFTLSDWEAGLKNGETSFLLHIDPNAPISGRLEKYLSSGQKAGVPQAYKCRVRKPWYSVPHVYQADAFLAVMSGSSSRMVANEAKVVATNSLHLVRLRQSYLGSGLGLSLLWQTSLAQLSTEIEGHSLGGGMLKLEPTEAEHVLVPLVHLPLGQTGQLAKTMDKLLRSGRDEDARELADEIFLMKGLGLSRRDCTLLWEATKSLRIRRKSRSIDR